MAAACDLIAKFVNIFINVKKIRIFFHSSLSLCCWPKSIMLGKNPANSSTISAAPGPRPCQMEVLHCRGGLWASVVSSYIWFMAKVLLKAFSNPPPFSLQFPPYVSSSKIILYLFTFICQIYVTIKNIHFISIFICNPFGTCFKEFM